MPIDTPCGFQWPYDKNMYMSLKRRGLDHKTALAFASQGSPLGETDDNDYDGSIQDLWNKVSELEGRIASLEAAGAGGSSSYSVSGRWQINPQAGAVPGGMQITADNESWTDATWLRLYHTDQTMLDVTDALTQGGAQDIYGQQMTSSKNWAKYQITAPGERIDDYIQVPVTHLTGGGSINPAQWQNALCIIRVEL